MSEFHFTEKCKTFLVIITTKRTIPVYVVFTRGFAGAGLLPTLIKQSTLPTQQQIRFPPVCVQVPEEDIATGTEPERLSTYSKNVLASI